MNATVAQLARLVDGNVVGDGDLAISSARTLDEAGPSDVSFLDGDKYLPKLLRSRAGAVVVPAAFEGEGRTFIRVADPLAAFVTLYRFLHAIHEPKPSGVDARAAVHPTAVVGVDASIAPLAHIGEHSVVGARCRIGAGVSIGAGCVLGDDVTVYANAVLYERTVVGNRVIIHAGAVIGADGFGYRMKGGRHHKVPQLGNVVIADDVEIGANATVDRATFGSTTIGEGSKIDNLVQVGHNCTIGRHNIFVAQVGFGGSCTTGDYVIVAGQAGIADHINVGSKAIINPKAGVGKDVPPGQRASGTPAMDWNDHLRQIWATGRLPRLMRDIKAIKQNLGIADET